MYVCAAKPKFNFINLYLSEAFLWLQVCTIFKLQNSFQFSEEKLSYERVTCVKSPYSSVNDSVHAQDSDQTCRNLRNCCFLLLLM